MEDMATDAIRRSLAEKELAEKVKDDPNFKRNAMDRWGIITSKDQLPIITGVSLWFKSRYFGQAGLPSHKNILDQYEVSHHQVECKVEDTIGTRNLCGFFALM